MQIGNNHYQNTKKAQKTIITTCEKCGSNHITVIPTRSIAIRKYTSFIIKLGVFTFSLKAISFLIEKILLTFFNFSFFMLFSQEHFKQVENVISNVGVITIFIDLTIHLTYYIFLLFFVINLMLWLYAQFVHNNQHYNVICLKCGHIEIEKEPEKEKE